MKENAFIISEYNPLHNGHKFHIEETRKAGAKNIICFMNGNFTQRGEPAVIAKSERAKAAVKSGADLVFELPLKYGISSANYFAKGGVEAALATGVDGTFSFGAKATASQLILASEILCKAESLDEINLICRNKGVAFPFACSLFLSEKIPEFGDILSDANNILAIEYLKAIRNAGLNADVFAVKRSDISHHDSFVADCNLASAKFIRELLKSNNLSAAKKYMPEASFDITAEAIKQGSCVFNGQAFSNIVMTKLIEMKEEDFTSVNGIAQGLENRIVEGIKNTSNFNSLCNYVKSKRFTHARIRQSLLAACFNITRDDLNAGVSYLRVLAFNENGRSLLREIKSKCKVPIITRLSEVNGEMSVQAQKDCEKDYIAGKLYELCKTFPEDTNSEYAVKPYYLMSAE